MLGALTHQREIIQQTEVCQALLKAISYLSKEPYGLDLSEQRVIQQILLDSQMVIHEEVHLGSIV